MIKAEIEDKELREYLEKLPKDDMMHFTMCEGRIRGAIFGGTHFVNQMRAQHKTGILETYILGQACLSGALLIPAMMKGREHVTWHYDVPDSKAKGFNVEAESTGSVRGFLLTDHIPIDKPLESWDMKPFLGGDGYMDIQVLHPDDKFPRSSSVNTTGSIADDLVFYFDKSEQINTAINLSIQMDKLGRVVGAGALFLQVLPETGGHYNGVAKKGEQVETFSDKEADEKLLTKVEECFKDCPSLGTWYSEGRTGEDLLKELFKDLNPVVAVHRNIKFDCNCNKESYIKYIRTLPSDELKDIREKNQDLEVVCRNCSSVYKISPSEI